jgi:hypothetical protein
VNPKGAMTFDRIIATIESSLGQNWKRIDFEDWKKTFATLSPDNPMYPLYQAYFAPASIFPARHGNYDCSNTLSVSGLPPPAITTEIIKKYTNFWTANLYK